MDENLKAALKFLLRRAAEEDQSAARERDRGNFECEEFFKRLAEENYRMVAEVQAGIKK